MSTLNIYIADFHARSISGNLYEFSQRDDFEFEEKRILTKKSLGEKMGE